VVILSSRGKADLLLLLVAAIWGFAFVAQKAAMDSMGPFSFGALRFGIGATLILPLAFREWRNREDQMALSRVGVRGMILGVFLFLGISLQQIGIVSTTAGNAGFITGLYAVFVPVLGVLVGHRFKAYHMLAGCLAVVGLYLLSVKGTPEFYQGDVLVLISAVLWAVHVLFISYLAKENLPITFAVLQFYTCSVLSFIVVPFAGEVISAGVIDALPSLLYAAVISVGCGYTLQLVAQAEAHPSYASVILSLEAVFAVLGGYFFLNEVVSLQGVVGAALMLAAMVISSLGGRSVEIGPGAPSACPAEPVQ
jgi:drug/metabolite transporter (DMT)-like permease